MNLAVEGFLTDRMTGGEIALDSRLGDLTANAQAVSGPSRRCMYRAMTSKISTILSPYPTADRAPTKTHARIVTAVRQ